MITKKEINKINGLIDVFYKEANKTNMPAKVVSGLWPVMLPTLQQMLDTEFNLSLDKIYASGLLRRDEDYTGAVIISSNLNYSAQKDEKGDWKVTEVKFLPYNNRVTTPFYNNADSKYLKFFNNIPNFIPKAEAFIAKNIEASLNEIGNKNLFKEYPSINKYPVILKEELSASM